LPSADSDLKEQWGSKAILISKYEVN